MIKFKRILEIIPTYSLCLIDITTHENILKTTIVDENNKDIELTWVKSERSFLANHNLPIRFASLNRFSRPRKVFRKSLNILAYHDLDKFSAVIYIEERKCLTGVIDTRYYIECLPVHLLNEKHHVVKENEVGYIFHYNLVSTFQNEPNEISTPNFPPSESNFVPSYDPNSINVDYDETFLESQSNFNLPELIDADLEQLLPTFPNSESSNDPVSPNLNHPLPASDSNSINVDYDKTLLHSQSNLDHPKLNDAELDEILSAFPNSESSINIASPDISPVLSHNSPPFFNNREETSSHLQPNLDFSILTNTVGKRNRPSTSCMYSPANKKRRLKKRSNEKKLDTLYPEILVFISYDITKLA
ncbi:hypothetical protein PV328_004409 [Microctonus aethiopoides]|uniref:Uncharacterized protein n=1 Tax=Microctonus aethiopoides TaxID=144406 RepID=A0AA39FAF7_9HYME|nr:hypothetical protein PV328_004409 [Microctonus aethiopoides]